MSGEVTRADGKPIEKPKDFKFFPGSVYRWIKTEQAGLDETLVEVKNGFVIFKSGRKCSLGVLQEMMDPIKAGVDNTAEIKAMQNKLTAGLAVEESSPKNPEDIPGLKNEYSDSFEDLPKPEIKVTKPPVRQVKPKVEEKPKSPVRLVLDGNKSTEKMTIKYEFEIDAPTKDIVNVLKNSFPDNNILDEVTDLLISSFNNDKVIDELKKFVKDLVKDRYNDNE